MSSSWGCRMLGYAGILLATGLLTQDVPVVLEEVVVEGHRRRDQTYVASIIQSRDTAQAQEQIARWKDAICVRVIGQRRQTARSIEVEVSRVLEHLGAPVAGPRCTANALIALTDEPDVFSNRITQWHRFGLFENDTARLAAFNRNHRASRWMHRIVAAGDPARGSSQMQVAPSTGPSSTPNPVGRSILNSGLPTIAMSHSRLELSTSAHIDRALIVLNANVAAAAPRQALTEYLAFVTAVDLGPQVEGTSAAILSLIGSDGQIEPAAALSDQDVAFVRALYASKGNQSAVFQATEIASKMGLAENP